MSSPSVNAQSERPVATRAVLARIVKEVDGKPLSGVIVDISGGKECAAPTLATALELAKSRCSL